MSHFGWRLGLLGLLGLLSLALQLTPGPQIEPARTRAQGPRRVTLPIRLITVSHRPPKFAPGALKAAGYDAEGNHPCGSRAWQSPLGLTLTLEFAAPGFEPDCALQAVRNVLERSCPDGQVTYTLGQIVRVVQHGPDFERQYSDWRYALRFDRLKRVVTVTVR